MATTTNIHSDTGTNSLITCLAPYFNSSSSSMTIVGSWRSYCCCWGKLGGRIATSGTVTSACNPHQSMRYYLHACKAYRAVIYMLLGISFSSGFPPTRLSLGGVCLSSVPWNVCVHQSSIFGRGFKVAFSIRHSIQLYANITEKLITTVNPIWLILANNCHFDTKNILYSLGIFLFYLVVTLLFVVACIFSVLSAIKLNYDYADAILITYSNNGSKIMTF